METEELIEKIKQMNAGKLTTEEVKQIIWEKKKRKRKPRLY